LELRQGEIFSLEEYIAARGRVRRIYEEAGFHKTQVRSRAEKLTSGVRVTIEVREGYRSRVDAIRITGRHHTKESVIRRILTFREGEPLLREKLAESEKRLYELGFQLKNQRRAFTVQQHRQLRQSLRLQWGYQIEEGTLDALADDLVTPFSFSRRPSDALTGRRRSSTTCATIP